MCGTSFWVMILEWVEVCVVKKFEAVKVLGMFRDVLYKVLGIEVVDFMESNNCGVASERRNKAGGLEKGR